MMWKKGAAILAAFLMMFSSCVYISPVFGAANFDDDGNRDQDDGLVDEEIGGEFNRPVQEQERGEQETEHELTPEMQERLRKNEEYLNIANKLRLFNVWRVEDGQFDENVTRGEFAALTAGLMNLPDISDERMYADVSSDYLYHSYIETLYNLEILSMPEDRKFRPDDMITYDEAIFMLVNALGYKEYAAQLGVLPYNYYMTAADMKIDKKELSGAKSLTRRNVADWFAELVKVKVPRYDHTVNQNTKDRITALERYHHIYLAQNVINAVGESYLEASAPVRQNEFRVGEIVIQNNGADISDYLGIHTDVYYTEDSNGNLYVAYMEERAGYNSVLEIDGRDIEDYKDGVLSYYSADTKKTRRESILSDLKAIFNNFEPDNFEPADIQNADYLKLIDNDRDGQYEVLFIENYEIHLLDDANTEAKKIYDHYSKQAVTIDFASEDVKIVDRNGVVLAPEEIQQWSVVAIGRNKVEDKMRVIVSNASVTGKVVSVKNCDNMDETTFSLEEDDTTYRFSANAEQMKGAGAPELNQSYRFYLDYKGRVAGYTVDNSVGKQYGYLIKAVSGGAFQDEVGFVIFSYVEGIKNYKAAKAMEIDGRRNIKGEEIIRNLEHVTVTLNEKMAALDSDYIKPEKIYNGSALYVRYPVDYATNETGEVTMLDTPYCSEAEDVNNRASFFDRSTMTLYEDFSMRGNGKTPGGTYFRNITAFNSDGSHTVAIDNGLKLFIVPLSNDFSVLDNYDNYDRGNLSYFISWQQYPKKGTNYRLDAYNVKKNRVSPLMVYHMSDMIGKEFDKATPLTVVSDIIQAVKEDGTPVTQLCGYQGNSITTVTLAPNVSLTKEYKGEDGAVITSTIRRGDIIRYETNFLGELNNYVKVFSLTDEDDPYYVKSGNEVGSTLDASKLPPTLIAVSDGKYSSNGHGSAHIAAIVNEAEDAGASYERNASYRVIYATLLYRNGKNLVLKTRLGDNSHPTESDNSSAAPPWNPNDPGSLGGGGAEEEVTTEICTATSFNFLCIDEERDKIYACTADELIAAYNTSEKEASKLILHTEGGRQRMLILVKRKQG
uniref:SLH domain-containing protein n=1 Tax=uncultured Bacillota bacterium TaxID=344338 RepID=A0A650EMF1_9FIRM|nr:hypothetical protein Firmicute1046_0250 [uncultured Firmicutes bacterium]